jgi:uncharacterized protein involved in outer membrane biogenesis
MRTLRWLILGVSCLALLVVAAPFVVPLKQFTPQLSELISMRLGHPVALADLRLSLWPTLGVTAQGTRIGKTNDIVAEDIRIEPELLSLFDDAPVIKLLRARKVTVNQAGVEILQGLTRRSRAARPESSSGLRVERIVLEDVRFAHSNLRLRSFDVEVLLEPGNALRQASFLARDGDFRLVVTPQGTEAFALDVQANNWTVPLKELRLTFASLSAQGLLRGDRLALTPIKAALYGGRVSGTLTLGWSGRWSLAAALDIRGVDVAKLQRALNRPAKLTGRLTARATLRSRAKRAAALANALSLDAPFRIEHGALGGMDLAKTAGPLSGEASSGGETQFDQFTGTLNVRGRVRRVEEFCARSSALVAGGSVQVDARERLSGRLDVSVANTAGLIRVPVRLSGTSSNPVATPSQLMSVGALIGTLLMPGVGTALGMSAASLMEGQVGCS